MSRMEKDITIIIHGEHTYKLSSACLRYASTFFDNMLSHPMKESNERKVEFPTKTKEEWELIHPYLDLQVARKATITYQDAIILLQWEEEFMMKSNSLKSMCDHVAFKHLVELRRLIFRGKWEDACCSLLKRIVDVLKVSFRYSLEATKPHCVHALIRSMGIEGAMALLYGMRPILGNEMLWEELFSGGTKSVASELRDIKVENMDYDGLMKKLHGDEWIPPPSGDDREKNGDEEVEEITVADEATIVEEIEQDVTILVESAEVRFYGDVQCEYKLSSACLRYASKYFDRMLSPVSEEELQNKIIDFPNMNWYEWKCIRPYLDLSVAQDPSVTCDHAKVLLKWNEELELKNKSIKPMCDEVICQYLQCLVMDKGRSYHRDLKCSQIDKDILSLMKVAFRYDLEKSKPACITMLSKCTGSQIAMSIVYGMSPILGKELLWETVIELNDCTFTGISTSDDQEELMSKDKVAFDDLIKMLHE